MTSSDLPPAALEGLEKAAAYGRDVMSDKVHVCKWVRLAVERHYRDLETGGDRGLMFDEYAAARALGLFAFLRHSKGEWAGQPIVLEPWQCWIMVCVFGWVYESSGVRRFRTVYEEIARKNGKTTKIGGVGIYGLVKDNEGGAEIYSAATKRDQARLMFDEATRMVNQSPALRSRIGVLRHNMHVLSTHSKFEPLSADANSMDGLNPHFSLVDELHAHKTSEVWDVLKSAQGARSQPLLWAITTAGFNKDGICYEVRDYTQKVLQDVIQDDSFFGIIYCADEGDDWRDESTWYKANPNLGVSVSLDYLRDQARQAEQMPRALTNFLTKHLNVWVNAESLWMNLSAWDKCAGNYVADDLAGLPCTGGLDLASTSDIASFVLVFDKDERGKRRTLCRHYLPEDAVKSRVQKNAVPYDAWARDGHLVLTPGNVTDYDFIERDIMAALDKYQVKAIGFDRWNSSQLVNNLMDEGAPMVSFGQGYASMNPAMRELERMVLAEELEHSCDPVLTWAMSNLVSKEDEAGNIKPAKNKSKEKIDPAVALIEAIGVSMTEDAPSTSVYESRGVITF